jgi:hypothetical protein
VALHASGEFNIEALGPKNAENAIFRTDTGVLMHDVTLLKPSRTASEDFAFAFTFKITTVRLLIEQNHLVGGAE